MKISESKLFRLNHQIGFYIVYWGCTCWWCVWRIIVVTGCLAVMDPALPATKSYRHLSWWCGCRETSITWSASPAKSAVAGKCDVFPDLWPPLSGTKWSKHNPFNGIHIFIRNRFCVGDRFYFWNNSKSLQMTQDDYHMFQATCIRPSFRLPIFVFKSPAKIKIKFFPFQDGILHPFH